MPNNELQNMLLGNELFKTLVEPTQQMEQSTAKVRDLVLSKPPNVIQEMLRMAFAGMKEEDGCIQIISALAWLRLREILEIESQRLRDAEHFIDEV